MGGLLTHTHLFQVSLSYSRIHSAERRIGERVFLVSEEIEKSGWGIEEGILVIRVNKRMFRLPGLGCVQDLHNVTTAK